MNVDAVFDQDAEDAFVIAVARQTAADAVRLDDPQSQRFAPPDRFCRQAPHQHDGEHVTVLRDPLDQLIERGFESSDFLSVVAFGHALLLALAACTGGDHILVPPEAPVTHSLILRENASPV